MIVINNWKIKTQNKSYETHKDKISEIYDMYFEKIHYKEPKRSNGEIIYIDKYNFRYSLDEISKKFKIINQIEIHFLILQDKRGHLGKCQFCNDGVYFSLRTVSKRLSCGHTGYCLTKNCTELMTSRYSYCHKHNVENWEKHESESLKKKKEDKRIADKLYIHDFMPNYDPYHHSPSEYVLALLDKNPEEIHKIYLTDIRYSIFNHPEDKGCYFQVGEKHYFTWCSAIQLEEAINDLIKWRHVND
jgi:hypothetical protein